MPAIISPDGRHYSDDVVAYPVMARGFGPCRCGRVSEYVVNEYSSYTSSAHTHYRLLLRRELACSDCVNDVALLVVLSR